MADLKSQSPAQTLDVLGRVCPYPLVLAKKALEKLSSGQVLKILSDAPASAQDSLPSFAKNKGYLCEVVKLEGQESWEVYIQKT